MKKLIISSLLGVAMAGSAQAQENFLGGLSLEGAIVAGTVAIVVTPAITGTEEQTSMDVTRRVCSNESDVLDGNVCVNTEVTTTVTVSGTTTVSIPVTVITTYPATVVTLH